MELDPIFLSRLQFAITIMFHYLYPPLSIGLGVMLVVMEWMFIKTNNPVYESMTKFWVRIFGLTFAMGVSTGIVMEFQFGTNWATYSRFVGDVFGSALAAEGIFAFFLESGFLAILLFGWDKVSRKVHFFSTCMVCLGSIFSAVWIVVANSWQQTPAGFHIVGEGAKARAEITSFWEVVFNPSSMARLTHVLVGAFILGSFFVMSITAYYILKNKHLNFARRAFVLALGVGTLASLAQLPLGHWSAVIVAKHQPAKLAAFEGIYQTEATAPLHLFGIPSDAEQKVKYGIAIPHMLSFLVHFDPMHPFQDFRKPVDGLDKFKPEDHPPVQIPFQTYHIMIGLGMLFIGVNLLSLFLLWRGKLFDQVWLLRFYVAAVIFPYITNQAGWVAAEVGRQPWSVYNLLRTSDSVSKSVSGAEVMASLVMFTLIYIVLFALFLFILDRKIKAGPDPMGPDELDIHHKPDDLLDAISRRGKMSWGQLEMENRKQ